MASLFVNKPALFFRRISRAFLFASLTCSITWSQSFQWTGVKGTFDYGVQARYGTQGVPDPNNHPGRRYGATSCTDKSGAVWVFGGRGYGEDGEEGHLNDLWKYDPAFNQWAWMSGPKLRNQPGNFGELGIASKTNLPYPRYGAVSWVDKSGKIWMFGGEVLKSEGVWGYCNDLWTFDINTGMWTWMKGSSELNPPGDYGTIRQPSPTNNPCGRKNATAHIDAAGVVWMFGGATFDSPINDVWKFYPSIAQWVWMKGSAARSQHANYGTVGVPGDHTSPGGLSACGSWLDASGMFWIFGGYGYAVSDERYSRSDLWRYNTLTSQWTLMKAGTYVHYGEKGIPEATNNPGYRKDMVTWLDKSGNLWIFGGYGAASDEGGGLSDLWMYDPTITQWTWIGGSEYADVSGNYGTFVSASQTSEPPNHAGSVAWIDSSGALWLFGGITYWGEWVGGGRTYWFNESSASLNDLWKFDPISRTWAWIQGPSRDLAQVSAGDYDTTGVTAATNMPSARHSPAAWTDNSGTFWMFGGRGIGADSNYNLHDLWKYQPSTGNWTCLLRSDQIRTSNHPDSRFGSATWYTPGKLWLFGGAVRNYFDNGHDRWEYFSDYNDFWNYDPARNKWVSITSTGAPSSRSGAATWVDSTGNLWLFGGCNIHNDGFYCHNGFYQFSPASGNWTLMGGSSSLNQPGVYGEMGTPGPSNLPGSRSGAVAWKDNSGNFWLFGGLGCDSTNHGGQLGDLWKYSPSTAQWTWIKGFSIVNQPGIYGTRGIASTANMPGCRNGAAGWVDPFGALWLFGGTGIDSAGTLGHLNDVWRYDISLGKWTWIKGSNFADTWGELTAKASWTEANTPGARDYPTVWYDSKCSSVYLFGGSGFDCERNTILDDGNQIYVLPPRYLNDLWRGMILKNQCDPAWCLYP